MSETAKQIGYLAAALKAPRIGEAAIRLAGQARDAGWTHEDYLIAVLDREVAARNASGAQLRIRAAGFPARKTFEEFNFDHQPGIRRDDITPLAQATTSPKPATSSSLAHQAPGKPTLRSPSASPPAIPDSGSCSPPPPTGSPVSKTPTNATGLPPSSPNYAATG
jgi:hypothetical protein